VIHRAAVVRLRLAVRAVVLVVDLLPQVRLRLVVLVPQEDTTVEDIDPDNYISMDVTKEGLALMYKSVCFHLEKWPGGHPLEQEGLVQMKDNLLRIMLEQQFRNQK
jgi:hypothetical protein